jgi:hypothetical protein
MAEPTPTPTPGIVGTIVARNWDDSPCPLTGRVTGQVDEEYITVAWGDEQRADYPREHTEPLDELRPVRHGV